MGKIHIEFDSDNKARFEIDTDNDSQMFTALLALESFIASNNDLPVSEIRSIMDEMKQDLTVKKP